MSKLKPSHLRFEKGLLSPVRLWLSTQGYVTMTEFRVPWGLCDVIGLQPDLDKVKERIALGQLQPLGGIEALMILNEIPSFASGRSASLDSIAGKVADYLSGSSVEKITGTLLRKKYIECTKTGAFRKRLPWFPYHTELIAIELKLDRVEEALRQAINHKAITHCSYVALPADLAEKVATTSRKNSFVDAGVGILAVTDANCSEMLKPSTKGFEILSLYGYAAAERCWSAVLETIHH